VITPDKFDVIDTAVRVALPTALMIEARRLRDDDLHTQAFNIANLPVIQSVEASRHAKSLVIHALNYYNLKINTAGIATDHSRAIKRLLANANDSVQYSAEGVQVPGERPASVVFADLANVLFLVATTPLDSTDEVSTAARLRKSSDDLNAQLARWISLDCHTAAECKATLKMAEDKLISAQSSIYLFDDPSADAVYSSHRTVADLALLLSVFDQAPPPKRPPFSIFVDYQPTKEFVLYLINHTVPPWQDF
jgi:hypothetical protein